jgi:small-conductance mechanosensitive channel
MGWDDMAGVAIVRAVIVFVVGLIAARLVRRLVNVIPADNLAPNSRVLVGRALFYGVFVLFTVMAIHQLGFDLSVLLGAAGIVSVALGFASQTSASNLISGLFLIGERAFAVGDVVKIGDITGEVLSVDLLSVKLRTFDNLYVRIPNEDFMKSRVTTMTWFPIRRYDLQIGIAYHVDIRKARDVLLQVARDFHLCLDDPVPLIILQGFGDSSINIQFSVWAARERYLDLRNGIHERVKEAFDREGIEIPFPHRTLYAGSQTGAMPVTLVDDSD